MPVTFQVIRNAIASLAPALVFVALLLASAARAEKMPIVSCFFRGQVSSVSSRSSKGNPLYLVNLTEVTAKSKNPLPCGIEKGKIYEVGAPASLPLRPGDLVTGTSDYDGTTSCVPDKFGRMDRPGAPVLKIEARQ